MTLRTVEGLAFVVAGIPAPQGSTRVVPTARGPRITTDNPNLYAWRGHVTREAARVAAGAEWTAGPRDAYGVRMAFAFPRPRSAPRWRLRPTVRPDLDKLERAVLDALVAAAVVTDDAQVTDLSSLKRYAGGPQLDALDHPGVHVRIVRIT